MPTPLPELPTAPERAFDESYAANSGRYQGQLHEVRWGYYRGWLHGQARRALVRKRWFQVVLHSETTAFVIRVQDDGLDGYARVFALDRRFGGHLFTRVGKGAPLRTMVTGFMAGEGTDAFWRGPGAFITLKRAVGASAWQLDGDWHGLAFNLTLDAAGAPPTALTIGAHAAPYAHRPGLTQRSPLLAVTGEAWHAGERVDLRGAVAEVTYANAFLAPTTRAEIVSGAGALADGRRVALALSTGDLHGSQPEATLWLGNRTYALPTCDVARTESGTFSWRGDALDLRFTTLAAHVESVCKGLGRVPQQLRWAVGDLNGRLPLPDGRTAHISGLRALYETHQWGA